MIAGLWIGTMLTFLATAAAQQDVLSIRNFVRVNSDFCTAGQPTVEQLTALKAEGIKAIINLRPQQEFDATQEEARAKQLGMHYFNIPVVYQDPKEEQATEFLRLTDDPQNRPALIHCAAAVRAGAFWMIRRVLRDGWSVKDAQAEAEKIGLRAPHLVEFATKYIEKYRKK